MGYGGYGWGGWGGTAQGDIARGLGAFNMGAGVYNRETAIATSINADTVMRWNQYLYLSQEEATRKYFEQKNANIKKNRNLYDSMIKRIQEEPTQRDVENGDALNAVLDQLGDPRIHSSAIRMASNQVDARLIRDIPFRNASEAVTISLSQLKEATRWPRVLRGPEFAQEQKDFNRLVETARAQDEEGDIDPDTIDQMKGVVGRIRNKLQAMPLPNRADNQEAVNFVKVLTGLIRLVETPDIKQVVQELEKIKSTSVGNLLGFMQTFNLRFAPASTPQQRAAYQKLYPELDKTRDRILAEANLPNSANDKNDGQISDFFSAMDLDHVEGNKPKPEPPKDEKQ